MAKVHKEVGCFTIDLQLVKEVAVQNVPRTKSVRTWYLEEYFIEIEDQP